MSVGDWCVVMGFRGCADMVNYGGPPIPASKLAGDPGSSTSPSTPLRSLGVRSE
jgi:hypothetical protein